jgi:hypothetical protein
MATVLDTKKDNFTRRWAHAITVLLSNVEDLTALKEEWDANAYATGAEPLSNNITDLDLARVAPWIDALLLNDSIGAAVSVLAIVDDNRGYLEAIRP